MSSGESSRQPRKAVTSSLGLNQTLSDHCAPLGVLDQRCVSDRRRAATPDPATRCDNGALTPDSGAVLQ